MTIAADMAAPLALLRNLRDVFAGCGLPTEARQIALIVTALEDCQERTRLLEGGPCGQRRPELSEIESGNVLIMPAWRERLRAGEMAR